MGFLNILINVVIPVVILNKFSAQLGPVNALVLALAFPLFYGVYDFFRNKHFNFVSLLGLLNVAITGGLAVLGAGGIWFAIKEAAFPLLIGLFVFLSAYGKDPFVKTLFFNPQLMDIDKLTKSLEERSAHQEMNVHLKKSTQLLAVSFLFSAVLNFGLAVRIFTPLAETLSADEKAIALNEQIAQMTSYSFVVIMLPSMIFLGFILWHLLSGIKKITGLNTEAILKNT